MGRKGIYSTIPVNWNEQDQILTIGERKGTFPGMLHKRTFRIVWGGENHGVGVEPEKNADQVVVYNGEHIDLVRR